MQGKDDDKVIPQNPSKHRSSPPRDKIVTAGGVVDNSAQQNLVNPEQTQVPRTKELATDQSIVARHLLYYPNNECLTVMTRCAEGIDSVMNRLKHKSGEVAENLKKDEILISMCTRVMADGGTGRLQGFNAKLAHLVTEPKPGDYAEQVALLAQECRENMARITTNAKQPGEPGALARQGILSFMGDLGGLEENTTGFGAAYKGPLCHAKEVYEAYVAGLCDHQRRLLGEMQPANESDLSDFEKLFSQARTVTSIKPGSLSAPEHTAAKKEERAPVTWDVAERKGLLNTGDQAEAKLTELYNQHAKTLVDASWPSYVVPEAVTRDVVEPVTGHVSGTFGEMAGTMNMFCGTPPSSITFEKPDGKPIKSAPKDQIVSIASLASAGLITAGFHSAVEVFQPMHTLTTKSTREILGPKAHSDMIAQARALRSYAQHREHNAQPSEYENGGYKLEAEELGLNKEKLLAKAESLELAATKVKDMISVLQGGGTLATLSVIAVLANQSTNPKEVLKLCSLESRLEMLGLRGASDELDAAREIEKSPDTGDKQDRLKTAIERAEEAADRRDSAPKSKPEPNEERSSFLLDALNSRLGKFIAVVGVAALAVGGAYAYSNWKS